MAMSGKNGIVKYGVMRDLADDLFSVWVRSTRVGCEMCTRKPLLPWELQNAHGFSRKYIRIRFNEDNVFALCPACHRKHSPSGPSWYAWVENRIGIVRYERLEFLKEAGPRLYQNDVAIIAADYLGRIEALRPGWPRDWARERAAEIVARSKTGLTGLPRGA